MKPLFISIIAIILSSNLLGATKAKPLTDPETIFIKKCVACHLTKAPSTTEQASKMSGPPILKPLKSVTITIDAIDGPFEDEELRKEVIAFMKDYIFHPAPDKTNCEPEAVEAYGYMPSLKGFISEKEVDILLPWLYDKFKPHKKNGEWE
jgi:hypothetical protein